MTTTDSTRASPLVRAVDLVKSFPLGTAWGHGGRGRIAAVAGVSIEVARGECVGLAGESGSGKSTLGRLLLALLAPDSGRVELDGERITRRAPRWLRPLRQRMQIVFQDPDGSLDPRFRVREIVEEGLAARGRWTRAERAAEVRAILGRCGLGPDTLDRYPHEFSGGQRQRIAIARALAPDPRFIVLDEPVSSLDVSVRAGILRLLRELRDERGLGYLLISHDLTVLEGLCHRIEVMYAGRIVEAGQRSEILAHPIHPYTRALLAAAPGGARRASSTRERSAPRETRGGAVPSPEPARTQPGAAGCPFAERCPLAVPRCRREEPEERSAGGRRWRCHEADASSS